MGIINTIRTAGQRLDDMEKRIDKIELAISGLATQEQIAALYASLEEVKTMLRTLIERQASNV